jgi:3'-5' exoribonuclease
MHDAGKIEEFHWNSTIKYTDSGHLIGHIVSGAMMIEKAADKIDGFQPILKMALVHMILSHHGEKEFGSPKRPKSVESVILHNADDTDAKVNIFRQAIAKPEADGQTELWTERHWLLDRPLFRGLPQTFAPDSSNNHKIPTNLFDAGFDPFIDE